MMSAKFAEIKLAVATANLRVKRVMETDIRIGTPEHIAIKNARTEAVAAAYNLQLSLRAITGDNTLTVTV